MLVIFASKNIQVLYQNRFCEQEDFDVVISGCTDKLKHSKEIKSLKISSRNHEITETIYHSKKHSECDRTICERSNVWTICSRIPPWGKSHIRESFKFVDSFRIYLDKTDQWINVIQTPNYRCKICTCSFMKNIYVFGGYLLDKIWCYKSCYKYDTKKSKWIFIASMNDCRQNAACTVFKGKIVLTGGYDGVNRVKLSSVEAYDYYENKWDFLPCMINKRCLHGAVSMGNKLFVIGGDYNTSCEVFDSSSMKFTSIKQLVRSCFKYVSAVSIGDKVLIFGSSYEELKERFYTYNVDKNEWYCESKHCFDLQDWVCLSKLPVV